MKKIAFLRVTLGSAFLLAGALAVFSADKKPSAAGTGVQITKLDDRLRVEIDGKLFTEYHFKNGPRPYCYPIIGPGELPMTRNWPMKDQPDEDHDHPHPRSLWYAHGDMNGQDFWSESARAGKTVHEKFLEVSSGGKSGIIHSQDKWIAKEDRKSVV